MRNPPWNSPIDRLGVRPDDPATFAAPRPRGSHGQTSRRPHTDAKVAAVRRLIERTTLTYSEIAARSGVARASICRWTCDGGWKRPPFAPRATDTVPSHRAGARLKARTLAARLQALAERMIRELEQTPDADLGKLGEALELLKMAKLAARARKPRRLNPPGRAMAELRAADVNLARAPRSAIEDFIASRDPPREQPEPRRRRHRSERNAYHAWLLKKE